MDFGTTVIFIVIAAGVGAFVPDGSVAPGGDRALAAGCIAPCPSRSEGRDWVARERMPGTRPAVVGILLYVAMFMPRAMCPELNMCAKSDPYSR